MKTADRILYALAAFAFAVAVAGSLSLAQIGPFNAPGGSTPTYGLQNQVSGSSQLYKSVAAPTGTASATFVMMGLAAQMFPSGSGLIDVCVTGDQASSVAADGGAAQLAWGTGTPPANAAAPVGTVVGQTKNFTSAPTTADKVGFADCVQIALTAQQVQQSVPIWLDLQFKAVTGGTYTIADVDLVAWEIH